MRTALASVIEKRGLSLSAEEVHRKYAEIEPSIQEGIGGKYVEVMRMGLSRLSDILAWKSARRRRGYSGTRSGVGRNSRILRRR